MAKQVLLKDIKYLTPYRVIDGKDQFYKEDILWRSRNDDINSLAGQGWINLSELSEDDQNAVVEIATDYEVLVLGGSEYCRKIQNNKEN